MPTNVTYNTDSHISILTQLHGSVWPRVLPYCIANSIIASIIFYLREYDVIDLTFSSSGHSFVGYMVSFLIVARSQWGIDEYYNARNYLSDACRSAREIVQHVAAFTRYDDSPSAKDWRLDVAQRTVAMLRTLTAIVEYEEKGVDTWNSSELTCDEKQAIMLSVGGSNERAPTLLAMFLRTAIASHVKNLKEPLHHDKELRLFQFISDFIVAHHGLHIHKTAPFPFPLIQMTRTVLALWVFTLPLCLANDIFEILPLTISTFIATYGFIGLELISIELDDPFGEDDNDFDVPNISRAIYEDIYLTIYDIDGKEAAHYLRTNIETQVETDQHTYGSVGENNVWNQFEDGATKSPKIGKRQIQRHQSHILGDASKKVDVLYRSQSSFGSGESTKLLECSEDTSESSV